MRSAIPRLSSSRRQLGRSPRADLLDQSEIDQFGDKLLRGAAFELRGQYDSSILPLRGNGQDDKLGIGEFGGRHVRDTPVLTARHHAVTAGAPRWR
jgi:hypothetical protein